MCIRDRLGAALGATLVLPAWAALPIFGGLGLGLALPFLAVGFVPALRNRLPRPGPWMAKFRKWMAWPMALTALGLGWLLWRQTGSVTHGWLLLFIMLLYIAEMLRRWRLGRISRNTTLMLVVFAIAFFGFKAWDQFAMPVAPTAEATAETFSPDALAKARATGKPVFVYFTADWCLSCKANEAGAINRAAVQEACLLYTSRCV